MSLIGSAVLLGFTAAGEHVGPYPANALLVAGGAVLAMGTWVVLIRDLIR